MTRPTLASVSGSGRGVDYRRRSDCLSRWLTTSAGPKHRRSGCLLCEPQKLTANVKADRRKKLRAALEHEVAA
jgi:hypothetical protein